MQQQATDSGSAQHRDVTAEGLQWISAELETTLTEANRALEQFERNDDNREALEDVAGLLHTVRGALSMVEVHGAALLAEEMVAVARDLHARKIANPVEGMEALSRALVQLPTYLERVAGGGRDVPLILLPLLNDLRAVRGRALLSESSLFIMNAYRDGDMPERARTHKQSDIRALARQLRPLYQSTLLQWLRGGAAQERLETLAQIAQKFEDAAATATVYQIWWVIGAVIEAIIDGGLRPSASIKRLLGQGDRQIKRLTERGEDLSEQDAPGGLLNNLLFYVGRATSDGPKVTAVSRAFNLEQLLEPIAEHDQQHAELNAPSVKLMKTVGAAIRQDLGEVKDAIDIFVRTDSKDRSGLSAQVDALRKIADTLGVLGLEELRQQIDEQSRLLRTFVDGQADVAGALMPIAASLIACEAALENQLVSQIVPGDTARGAASAAEVAAASDRRAVIEAVLRECVVNLTRVKEALSQFVEDPETGAPLDPVAANLRGVAAGLLMLEKSRAVEMVEAIGWHIAKLRTEGVQYLTPYELDRLADAIVSVEYYMETVQKGRSDPEYMLDNAQACLAALSTQPPERGDEPDVAPPAPTPSATAPARPARGERRIERVDQAMVEDARVHVDPELLELFIEEAKEEIATLNRNVPRWRSAPDNRELLLGIRRAFHTLKGSGRMVGARVIAEFSWALEEVLNEAISHEVHDPEALGALLADGLGALPQLVEQLESGTTPSGDINAIVARAQQLKERPARPAAAADADDEAIAHDTAELPHQLEPAPVEADPEPTVTLDPVLYDIFRKEAMGHLEAIDAFVTEARKRPAPYRVEEPLHRAWHTLSGSANMAAVVQVVDIARPMNEFLRMALNEGGSMSARALETMATASSAVATIVERINSSERLPDTTALCGEIARLEHVSAADAVADAVNYDPDIAAIYADEAHELLEASDAALASWLEDTSREDAMAELLRHLHTLKGGARMAGVQTMATLSPELETLFERLQAGELPLGERCRAALRHGFDRLHAMQEALAGHAAAPDGAEIVREIQALLTSPETEPAPAETSTAPPVDLDALFPPQAPDVPPAQRETAHVPEPEAAAPAEADEAPIEAATDHAPEPAEAAQEAVEEAEVEASSEAPAGRDKVSYDEVASVADEMAELVEELRDVSDSVEPLPESVPTIAAVAGTDGFESRLAEATEDARDTAYVPPAASAAAADRRRDVARVDARLLDEMLNNAGEVSIFHSRMEQEVGSIAFNLAELSQTVSRLREQLRKLDSETEAQIRYRHQDDGEEGEEFDPLELDRYSTIQQLSRALAESVSDLVSIQELLSELTRESESLLVQQNRVTTELQDALIRTRMLPFSNFTPRLERVVRGAAREAGKQVALTFKGESGELDRQVLQRMMPPFEHMLRNAVVHGIERPQRRVELGKPAEGQIEVSLHREGAEMVITVKDDGGGLDVQGIKAVAIERGLIDAGATLAANETLNLILQPGFSTATEVTHQAGRGVGMDVVANEVKLLGGSFSVESQPGIGTAFTARLPLTLAVTQALLVRCGHEQFAIPLPAVEGIVRVPRAEAENFLRDRNARYIYGSQEYRFAHLGRYVGTPVVPLEGSDAQAIPVVLVRAGEHSTALITDELIGSREVVVKAVGPLVSGIPGIAGATILGDGSIVVILDVATLVRRAETVAPVATAAGAADERPLIMVVDDSITVRRVTERLLERNDMRVITAKDGADAVALMQDTVPDLMLLDIEMPRMDGYEVTTHIRNSDHLKHLPIVMVTSRTGDKHRKRALELGVDGYLGKPYQESQLLDAIRPLLEAQRGREEHG